ncbi:MAG: aminodeoxychorismate synthase component I [Deltaproteobacteria bacterium]|nr:aminodeoxychorismate synthase component I [Deltaproteobacteria bacterium]
MKIIQQIDCNITGIHSQPLELQEPFIDMASRFADQPGTVVLMSGGDLDCARYHMLGLWPWLSFKGKNRDMRISAFDGEIRLEQDPFDTLREIINVFQIENREQLLPLSAGLMGYLAYDLKDSLETLPRTTVDDLGLPDICFYAPSLIVTHDRVLGTTKLQAPRLSSGNGSRCRQLAERFLSQLNRPMPAGTDFTGNRDSLKSGFGRSDYMAAIDAIKEYIAAGDVYQVSMSQRFEANFEGSGFDFFRALFLRNPAPFFAYVNAGDHQIVSTSPERFLSRAGTRITTRPIKGTRPRGRTEAEDLAMRRELEQSVKDDAELSMIVDLLRNDMGKVCKGGSVTVTAHKRLEAYQNVYHLVSDVVGELDCGKDSVDLIKATFPGGSITGCPKIRAMEIIETLEPKRRHIYTGSIGYISFHNTLDLSIAIRTATLLNSKIVFSVGGGIVFDSDPADEFDETLHKGKTLMDVFGNEETGRSSLLKVWLDGKLVSEENAAVNVFDRGLQYGYGFFETIRVDDGRIGYLSEHLERFNRAWSTLFNTPAPDVHWGEIIPQTLAANGLEKGTVAVKILATGGRRDQAPYDRKLMVFARPYIHRLEGKKEQGQRLMTYPEPRQTPLAGHKTLNYLYYFLAGRWARESGGDEAVILNPDGTVSETNTANILVMRGKKVLKPISPHVLPGVMAKVVCKCLQRKGYQICEGKTQPEDLFSADGILLTNSLMGAVPALSLNGKKLQPPSGIWREINREVL